MKNELEGGLIGIRPVNKYKEEAEKTSIYVWLIISVGLGDELNVRGEKEGRTRKDSQISHLMLSFMIIKNMELGIREQGWVNFKKCWVWGVNEIS